MTTITFEQAVDIGAAVIVAGAVFIGFVYPPLTMRRVMRQSCIALARAVESREPFQLGHSERTAALVVEMARRSGRFAPWQLWEVENAALLHMIGKVGVAHGLLNSAIPPGGNQLFELRDYVRIGAEILNAIPPLKAGAETVAYHREYLDGSGYPFGRYGEEIPFASRLLCVATEYAAMTSPRIYRPLGNVLSQEQALDYLHSRAGQIYDPEAVALLTSVLGAPKRPTNPERAELSGGIGATAQ
jgi:HD-GYP domain-containing protein (c-di-GMP phosphodiesterase class II)